MTCRTAFLRCLILRGEYGAGPILQNTEAFSGQERFVVEVAGQPLRGRRTNAGCKTRPKAQPWLNTETDPSQGILSAHKKATREMFDCRPRTILPKQASWTTPPHWHMALPSADSLAKPLQQITREHKRFGLGDEPPDEQKNSFGQRTPSTNWGCPSGIAK